MCSVHFQICCVNHKHTPGVSEGEFAQVLQSEVVAVHRGSQLAAEEFGVSNYRPLITFLSVQKRHHTKFFAKTGSANMQWDNVPSGACGDFFFPTGFTNLLHTKSQQARSSTLA